jgi:type IV pilus assembly protein PilF
MLKWFRTSLLFLLFGVLCACRSTPPSTNGVEDKKTTAAKINVRLGLAYLDRDDISRAKQKFLLALELSPKIPEPWYAMGYFQEKTGNMEEAQNYYLKAVKLGRGRGDSLNNYGTFLCRQGNYKDSIDYFLKAVKDPKYLDSAAAYENAGLCARKIPDKMRAIVYFNKAVTEDPNRPLALINLAELHYQQGSYVLARNELRQYLQIAPPTHDSYILEQKIDAKLQM